MSHQPTRPKPSRRYLQNSRWRGPLTLVHVRLFFADSRYATLHLRDRVASLLDHLGPGRNPKKGHWEPTQNLRAPRTPYRHHNLCFPSPAFETTSQYYTLPDPTATLCTRHPLATCPTARSARRKSAIPLPHHSSSMLLPPRTARRPRYAHMMGRTGTTHLSGETRPPMVDASPLRHQWTLHILPNRDRLHAQRQLMLRLGSSVERAIGSTWFLVSGISTATHHIERVEGRTSRSLFVPTALARTKSTHARGQSGSGGYTQSPQVPVAGYDGQTSETMETHRHQQHQHARALYSIPGVIS
jgi:hypothetical protein